MDGAGSINLSDMMHAYPYDVVKASLNNIPEELTLAFPDYTNTAAKGEIQDSRLPPSDFPLDLWPVFPVDKGTITSINGGTEYAVRQEQLLATLTMSGGRVELEDGVMRELHWHSNADELHYVLSGKSETLSMTTRVRHKSISSKQEILAMSPSSLSTSFRLLMVRPLLSLDSTILAGERRAFQQ